MKELGIILISLFICVQMILANNDIEKLKKKSNTLQKKVDSLEREKTCYCKKLEFLDTLSDKEIETAFKKSRCKIL